MAPIQVRVLAGPCWFCKFLHNISSDFTFLLVTSPKFCWNFHLLCPKLNFSWKKTCNKRTILYFTWATVLPFRIIRRAHIWHNCKRPLIFPFFYYIYTYFPSLFLWKFNIFDSLYYINWVWFVWVLVILFYLFEFLSRGIFSFIFDVSISFFSSSWETAIVRQHWNLLS